MTKSSLEERIISRLEGFVGALKSNLQDEQEFKTNRSLGTLDMPKWKFSCESKSDIPLPPEYTFPRAFNYLNAERNSFYILANERGDYIQCGGSKEQCTVEVRIYDRPDFYTHYVVGHRAGSDEPGTVQMSGGEVKLLQRERLTHWEAIELFKCFFSGDEFPSQYSLRKTDL